MRILRLDETDSTNSYVERNAGGMEHGTVVTAHTQLAGRGQRGNSWESEPGANLTCTMLLRPGVEAVRQFSISETVALAVCDALEQVCGVECKVKWPNDIYAGGDRKICGILISHSLTGRRINHSVAGMGININQRCFLSDAPNPVSVWQLTGREHDPESVLVPLASAIERGTLLLGDADIRRAVHERYMSRLWRGDGALYPFTDTATGERFMATVQGVEPTGHLLLRDNDGALRRFAFKEVAWS